jgi:origin recognition complex subunit 6
VKAFSIPAATFHIYTGIESIFPLLVRMSAAAIAPETPSKRYRQIATVTHITAGGVSNERVLALIAVVLLYVISQLLKQDITTELYSKWRRTAITTLLCSPAAKDTTEEDLTTQIKQMMPIAREEG